ncbi:MAG: putative two-component system response regulator [Pseudohongiellaceae bacterium]
MSTQDNPIASPGEWTSLHRSAILIVDDDPGVRDVVARCLQREDYRVLVASGLAEARTQLDQEDVIIALVDITLSHGESGLQLLEELRQTRPDVDVIMMTAHSDVTSAVDALQKGAYDYLCKPFPFQVLAAAVKRAVDRNRFAERVQMLDQLDARRAAGEEHLQQFLMSLASVIDAKSRFTAQHSRRVSGLSRLLAEALGMSSDHCDLIALGGRLHDIGKIGTPDAILDKAGPLTAAEFDVIKEHPALGDELIAPIKDLAVLRPMIRWHHESLDGKGYPDHLPGHKVPTEAWVVKTADYWEAITSQRPYREPMPLGKAVRVLRGESGTRIPAHIVETFIEVIQGHPLAVAPSAPTASPPATIDLARSVKVIRRNAARVASFEVGLQQPDPDQEMSAGADGTEQ